MDPIDKLNEEGKDWAEALQRAEELYANLQKLKGRAERGTLKGDGEDR